MLSLMPILLYLLVLLDVQTSYQEIQKCNGVISICLQNAENLSQLYISNKANETNVRNLRRKNTTRIHKKNRRKNFHRKIHRHSTRVLTLKPASILLPPYENDIQKRNVSTLNPFIINVLAISKNSSSKEKLGFFSSLPGQDQNQLNKPYSNIISSIEFEQNSTNKESSNIRTTTEHVKNPIIVPPSGPTSSDLEVRPTATNFQFSDDKDQSTPSNNKIQNINTFPPPFQFLLPPFLEIENNGIETQLLENPNDLQLPDRPTDFFETSTSFSTNEQTITVSLPSSSSVKETVHKELNQISSNVSHEPVIKSTVESIFSNFNKTEVREDNLFTNMRQNQERNSYSSFNNTLLAPEVASLGMKIVTSQKGLEMIKEFVSSKRPKSSKNDHPQYEESQSLLETAESGDIRLHTYNQILSIEEEAKDVGKSMYKALKKPQKKFELCSSNQGYVADQSSGCQVFYICLGSGAGEPMMCPNGTLFNQEVLVCDWWYNVECSG